MKRIRIVIVAVIVVVALMVTIHLTLSVNWPELLRSLHGR
jgi:hypothetical protein